MSDLISLETGMVSRRTLLRSAALAIVAGGLDKASAQHVHDVAAAGKAENGGVHQPKAFNEHEYRTIQRLADLIVPADEHSKGAIEGGAPEFIDLLSSENSELASIYTGGIAWMDRTSQARFGSAFVDAKPENQIELLNQIAYRKFAVKGLVPGVRFFSWIRKMTVDAYYTSKVGIEALGYMGNIGMKEFVVPQAALDYAIKRSPV